MKRRNFLAAACMASMVPLSEAAPAKGTKGKSDREFYELRHYLIKSQDKQKRVLDFLKAAEIPALNRIDISPIGVFKISEDNNFDLYVLLPHKSLASVVTASSLIVSDTQYNKDGAELLDAPKSDTPYERIESSLMLAFEAIPKIELPTKAQTRIFQLRIYESHNLVAAKKKIEMFNTGGELEVFRKTGMDPVFFGQSLIGSRLPNLTYMLGFDDMETKEKSWGRFGKHPDWLKLKADPYYKDLVSNITNIMLEPALCSQI